MNLWQRIAWRVRYKGGFVERGRAMRLEIKRRLAFGRIRVGFGPVMSPEGQADARMLRIDSLVDWINRHDDRFVCDYFYRGSDLTAFDVVVIVKELRHLNIARLRAAARRGCRFVLSLADLKLDDPGVQATLALRLPLMHALVLGSPAQRAQLSGFAGGPIEYLPTHALPAGHKRDYALHAPLRLFWEGHRENVPTLAGFDAVLERAAAALDREVELVVHTDLPTGVAGRRRVVRWDAARAHEERCAGDIAVAFKPPEDRYQQQKPPSKLITYMGAGLPIICTPSVADREVLVHEHNGLFAASPDEWVLAITRLAGDAALRQRLGETARRETLERFGIERVARAHVELFERLRQATDRR